MAPLCPHAVRRADEVPRYLLVMPHVGPRAAGQYWVFGTKRKTHALSELHHFGDGVRGFQLGDQVADLTVLGSNAAYRTLRPSDLIRVPAGVDAAEAAALILSFLARRSFLLAPTSHVCSVFGSCKDGDHPEGASNIGLLTYINGLARKTAIRFATAPG